MIDLYAELVMAYARLVRTHLSGTCLAVVDHLDAIGVTRVTTTTYVIPRYGVDFDLTAGRVYASNALVVDPPTASRVGRLASAPGAIEAMPATGRPTPSPTTSWPSTIWPASASSPGVR